MNRLEELEAAIDADPYDPRAYAVLGDHLQELGDPRGELIALQIANAADAELFTRHPALLPTQFGRLRWHCGFVQRAELPATRVAELLEHPSSRFLAELAIDGSSGVRYAIDTLASRSRPALRALWLGVDPVPELENASLEWPADPPPSLADLWPCLPNLKQLRIHHGYPPIDPLDLPHLVELELCTTLAEPYARAVAQAEWPQLEVLELQLEMAFTQPSVRAELRHLLLDAPPPKLRHLCLRGTAHLLFDVIDEPELARLPIRSLDLSRNVLRDDHARSLARSGIHLEHLNVSSNQLSAAGIQALSAIATTVLAHDQFDPDDDPIEGLYDY